MKKLRKRRITLEKYKPGMKPEEALRSTGLKPIIEGKRIGGDKWSVVCYSNGYLFLMTNEYVTTLTVRKSVKLISDILTKEDDSSMNIKGISYWFALLWTRVGERKEVLTIEQN